MKKAYPYIRFSTKEQEHGDSERRQRELIEDAKSWVENLGYTLDHSLNLIDKGKSAFNGTHRTEGALGRFLKGVAMKEIKRGSMLIVESFDRLSRENPEDAMMQFMNLKKDGIKIGILSNRKVYEPDQPWTELFYPLVEAGRAHEESKRKSERLKAANQQKRETRDKKHRAPAWLKSSKDKRRFTDFEVASPKVYETFEKIFTWKREGVGSESIAKRLNTDKSSWKPPRRDKDGNWYDTNWRKSYIQKILSDRAVLGEYWPHRLVRGNGTVHREPVEGGPIKDYYPSIIENEQFDEVQRVISRNKEKPGQGGGRKGLNRNLFTSIARCGLCGGPMHYEGKGQPPRGYPRLRCRNSREKVPNPQTNKPLCNAKAVRYDELETIIFRDLEELDFDKFMPEPAEITKQINVLQKAIDAREHRFKEVEREIQRNHLAISKTKNESLIEGITRTLERLYEEKNACSTDGLRNQKRELEYERENQHRRLDKVKELRQLLEIAKDEEQESHFRKQIQDELQRMIKSIRVYPLQEKYVPAWELDTREVQFMHSKFIDKVSIDFNRGHKTVLRILPLKTVAELVH